MHEPAPDPINRAPRGVVDTDRSACRRFAVRTLSGHPCLTLDRAPVERSLGNVGDAFV